MAKSLAEVLALQPEAMQREWLAKLPKAEQEALQYKWTFWARPEQLAPDGDWSTWLIKAGRGWGKTKTGAEWVRAMMCGATPLAAGKCRNIGIIAETSKDLRETIAKGPSGILAVHPKEFRPSYTEKGGFVWPNGAKALVYNGTEPDQLRGPNLDAAWCDELAKWRYSKEAWDNLQYALRLGDDPRVLITTTPRPIRLMREIMDEDGTLITEGSLYDNVANLPEKYIRKILDQYEGTRLGRQEIYGEIIDDVPGALWTRDTLDRKRLRHKDIEADKLPAMQRVVVAIDPAAKASTDQEDTAETGIIVCGLGVDGRGYVLDDRSCRLGPQGWARVAINAYDRYQGDLIVAERNNGGEMVTAVIKSACQGRAPIKIETVWASRGKVTRAEPISALYEQGRVSHVGSFPALEDQMIMFTPWGIEGEEGSDRTDALVWGLSQLFPLMVNKDAPRKRRRSSYVSQDDRSGTTGY